MSDSLTQIFTFSIAIAAMIGWIRIRNIGPTYYPFIICITIGAINELISYRLIYIKHQSNAINANIYVLLEAFLLLYQFKNWRSFRSAKFLFWIIAIAFCGAWLTENFIIGNIRYFSSYFRVFYAVVLVLLSINQVNMLLVRDRKTLFTNPIFLICSGIIIYYTYKILVEMFWIYGLNNSPEFNTKVYDIHTIINLISNLIYGWAVLWIQKKQRFSLPS